MGSGQDTQKWIDAYVSTRAASDRDRVVAAHLYIAGIIARKFSGRGVEYDDLYQVASLALVKATERFDPGRGVKFVTFVTPSMAGEVKNYFRDKSRAIRVPRSGTEAVRAVDTAVSRLSQELLRSPTAEEVAEECGMSLEGVLEAMEMRGNMTPVSLDAPLDGDGDMPGYAETVGEAEPAFLEYDNRDMLARAMERLTGDEAEIMRMRYFSGMSQRVIAQKKGISQMTVSRTEKRALVKLRAALADAEDGI